MAASSEVNKPLSTEEKIQRAYEVKDEGNQHFKLSDYQTAIKRYHHALLHVKGLDNKTNILGSITGLTSDENKDGVLNEKMKKSVKELEFMCYNNLAACLLKKENFEKASHYATKAIDLEPKNCKALFRRGTAYFQMNNYAKAEEDFNQILKINPKETSVQKYLSLIEKEKQKDLEKEKRMYSKMF